jgi:hypothetical protein
VQPARRGRSTEPAVLPNKTGRWAPFSPTDPGSLRLFPLSLRGALRAPRQSITSDGPLPLTPFRRSHRPPVAGPGSPRDPEPCRRAVGSYPSFGWRPPPKLHAKEGRSTKCNSRALRSHVKRRFTSTQCKYTPRFSCATSPLHADGKPRTDVHQSTEPPEIAKDSAVASMNHHRSS